MNPPTPSLRSLRPTRKKATGKAVVRWTNKPLHERLHNTVFSDNRGICDAFPVLVQPFPTIAAARLAAKWANKTHGEKMRSTVFALANAGDWSFGRQPDLEELACAILTLLAHSAPKAATNTKGKGEGSK